MSMTVQVVHKLYMLNEHQKALESNKGFLPGAFYPVIHKRCSIHHTTGLSFHVILVNAVRQTYSRPTLPLPYNVENIIFNATLN